MMRKIDDHVCRTLIGIQSKVCAVSSRRSHAGDHLHVVCLSYDAGKYCAHRTVAAINYHFHNRILPLLTLNDTKIDHSFAESLQVCLFHTVQR